MRGLLRALVLSIREQEYVEAARATGASDLRIMFRQIVPNILSPVIVESTLRIGGCILMISSLSFIGLGVQPPTPEWGSMLLCRTGTHPRLLAHRHLPGSCHHADAVWL